MSSVYFNPGSDSSVNGNITKMENAKVEIDDGKEESALPDTLYYNLRKKK